MLLEFDGRAQAVAAELALASGLSRSSVFDLLVYLLRNGLTECRRACCQALAKFDDPQADSLVLELLDDPDANVQALAVRQLRARRIPDALQRLVALLDSRSPEVRDAARSSLAEFNFTRYRTMFDLLDEQAAHTTGVLVRKVDHSVQQKLAEELSSPSVTMKVRGIEMAIAMEATNDVQQQLIDLAGHENVAVRKEAVTALAHCSGDAVVAALKAAAADPHHSIAEAARHSLINLPQEPTVAGSGQPAGEVA
jgi:HEAT repeat protein